MVGAISGSCTPKQASATVDEVKCVVETGVDFWGNDLWNTPSASIDQCHSMCLSSTQCTHFTFAWGSCYFKKSSAGRVAVAQATSATCRKLTAKSADASVTDTAVVAGSNDSGLDCKLVYGVDYAGNDVWNKAATAVTSCIETCRADNECKAFTFVWGKCFFKHADKGYKTSPTAISGICSGA